MTAHVPGRSAGPTRCAIALVALALAPRAATAATSTTAAARAWQTALATGAKLTGDDHRLLEATLAFQGKDMAKVVELTESDAGRLDDYRSLLRGRALAALGQKDRAIARLESIKPRTSRCTSAPATDHPLFVDAVLERAKLLAEAQPKAAADLLGSLHATPDLIGQMIDLYRRAGDAPRVAALELKLLVDVPESFPARRLAEKLGPDGVQKRLGELELRLTRLRHLLDGQQNAAARDEARAIEKTLDEKDEHRCELAFMEGKATRKLREYKSSLEALGRARTLCQRHKSEELALRAALLEVQVRTVRGSAKEMKAVIDWMRKVHPNHSYIDDALVFLAGAYSDAGNTKAAKAVYTEIADRMPDADSASEALWRLGYMAIQADERAEATKRLESLLDRRDIAWPERGRARYWLARTIEKTDAARARTLDEENVLDLSFYGWLTLSWLEEHDPKRAKALEKRLVDLREAEPKAADPGPQTIVGADELTRALALYGVGAKDYAEGELELLACRGASDDEALALALAFDAVEAHRRAQEILRAHEATMLKGPVTPDSLRTWRAAYSRPYLEWVEKAAAESKVEPLFLLALVREESTFDPAIVSWAGAVGLAQLMPGTAVGAHAALRLGKLDPERLTDPALNLRLGARVLHEGLVDFRHEESLALVAYNGGPGVAKRLLDPKKPKAFDRWVEDIGIRETRGYVKRVMGTWGIYRFLYDRSRPFVRLPNQIGGAVSD